MTGDLCTVGGDPPTTGPAILWRSRYSSSVLNVSPWVMSPVVQPRLNQRIRWALVPWVKESGTTLPPAWFCRLSSPMALAQRRRLLDVARFEELERFSA